MFCTSCCQKKHPTTPPTYEVSVAVQPRPMVRVTSVQTETPASSPLFPITRPFPNTSATSSLAHVRFHSTDHVSMATALRSSPSTIYTVPEDGKK